MSTIFRWRVTLAALAAICAGGAILTVLLVLGLGDPPRAGALQWQTDQPPADPQPLPAVYTLELMARNTGAPESAWGIRLEGADDRFTILIDNQGYFSVSSDDALHWAAFPHIRPFASNQIYLNLEADGTATLRINHEIAWQGTVHVTTWLIAEHGQPLLDWDALAQYHE